MLPYSKMKISAAYSGGKFKIYYYGYIIIKYLNKIHLKSFEFKLKVFFHNKSKFLVPSNNCCVRLCNKFNWKYVTETKAWKILQKC